MLIYWQSPDTSILSPMGLYLVNDSLTIKDEIKQVHLCKHEFVVFYKFPAAKADGRKF